MKLTIIFTILLASCAILKNENDFYDFIFKCYKNEQYSLASGHIITFEAKYPESPKLCELWKLQFKIYEQDKKDNKYLQNTRKKFEEKCKTN